MSILKELRYVIRLLGDIIHPKVKLICKGGGEGERGDYSYKIVVTK